MSKANPMDKVISEVGATVDDTPEKKVLPTKKLKSFGDVNEKIEFHTDLDKIEFDAILGMEITVIDAKLIRDFDSKFGKHDFMIVHAETKDGGFTFGTSGMVLIKRIMGAQEDRKLPLTGTIAKPEGKPYYDIN